MCRSSVLLACTLLFGCAGQSYYVDGLRNPAWVTSNGLRVAHPKTIEQWRTLRDKYHVTTFVSLSPETEASDRMAESLGITVWRLGISPRTDAGLGSVVDIWRQPSPEMKEAWEWVAARIAFDDGQSGTWAWGCVNAHDRTGVFSAMVLERARGWTRGQLFRYMLDTGFHAQLPGLSRWWASRWKGP